jgi:mono/diheme cytochrome c family protein
MGWFLRAGFLRRHFSGAAVLILCTVTLPAQADDLARGAQLASVGNCAYCHQNPDSPALDLSGGRVIDVWFGQISAPNITPDPKTGIGAWTLEVFQKALRQGVSPYGLRYQGVFPTDNYRLMSDADIAALYHYLMAQRPQPAHMRPLTSSWFGLGFFKRLIDRWRFDPVEAVNLPASGDLAAGAYWVEAVGHCAQCHSPRGDWGHIDPARAYAGSKLPLYGGGKAPNITPDKKTGLGDWTIEDIAHYLETGESPEFHEAKGSMAAFIRHGLKALSDEDRLNIARYLQSLAAINN